MKTNSPSTWQPIVIALVVIGLLGLALGGYLTPIFNVSTSPLIAAERWVSGRFMTLYELLTMPRDVASLRQRNMELENEVSRLQSQIIELKQRDSEYQVLSELLKFRQNNPENQGIAASIIGRDPSPFLHYVIIDRGSDDGLRHGMPVVTNQGLVGSIDAVTAGASRVKLITDPSSAINVRIQSSQKEAILLGSITGDLSIDMIPQDVALQIGDVILTSGLGGGYPDNLFIGQIVSIQKKENDLFQSASVQPVVDFGSLKAVLVITNFQPVDISPLVPTVAP